jgi:glutaminase
VDEFGEMFAISTGHLPIPEQVRAYVAEALERFRLNDGGALADQYSALAKVPKELFGISIASVDGGTYSAGDADYSFTMMSISKPFVFALLCEAIGSEDARARLGVNATGLPFNSIMAVELSPQRLTNPMVNPGALATTSLVPGTTAEEKWQFIRQGLSRFAGHDLELNKQVYASAVSSNDRNRGIARLLRSYDRLYFEPEATTDIYTRQCSLNVTARDLATMGATLSNGGVNPLTRQQVVTADCSQHVLAVMATSGMYESTGDWLYDVGLPGKSGIGGGIVTISPGKGSLSTFAPLLDQAGNSVKGQLAARFLSERLGLNLFASRST